MAPAPTSFAPSWLQRPPERVNTHAAPTPLSSADPPTMAVSPSPERETDSPCDAVAMAPAPTTFAPCWLHTPAERVKTDAAPAQQLSTGPPTMAVFPSAESETEKA